MTPLLTEKSVQQATILERCVCLVLSCGYVGNARSMDVSQFSMEKNGEKLDAEKRRLAISKRLVDSEHLRPCVRTIEAAKAYLRANSVGGHRVFGSGTYLIPYALVGPVTGRLKQFAEDLEGHATVLSTRWSDVIEESKKALGKLADGQEFPTAADVLAAYKIDWHYVSFQAPERLEAVDRAIYDAEQAKYDARLASAYEEAVLSLRAQCLRVMQELVDRLKPGADGKPRRIFDSALRDLQDLAERLPKLNVAGDDALTEAFVKVAALADGIDVDTLRQSRGIQSMLHQAAEQAVATLDQLVHTGRAISFDPTFA